MEIVIVLIMFRIEAKDFWDHHQCKCYQIYLCCVYDKSGILARLNFFLTQFLFKDHVRNSNILLVNLPKCFLKSFYWMVHLVNLIKLFSMLEIHKLAFALSERLYSILLVAFAMAIAVAVVAFIVACSLMRNDQYNNSHTTPNNHPECL